MNKINLISTLCAPAILFLVYQAWPEDTLPERIVKLENQVKEQKEMITFLYRQLNFTAGSKEPKEPKCLKMFIKIKK
jgi:hypothetical protein